MNNHPPPAKNRFGSALQAARALTDVTQEDFGEVSSRTYVSTLERGLKSPTLSKVDDLSSVLGIHPLTLLTLSYCDQISVAEVRKLLANVEDDLSQWVLVGPKTLRRRGGENV